MLIVGRLPNNCMRATLALTHGFKNLKVLGINGHNVTLLRLVTPNFEGTHTLFITRDVTYLEIPPATAVFNELGERITQATSANVMNERNWIIVSTLPTSINNLLASALHFRVLSLHRSKVEIFGACATGHRGRGTAA